MIPPPRFTFAPKAPQAQPNPPVGPRSIKQALRDSRQGVVQNFEPLDPFKHGIRQSDLAQFLACRQKARLCQYLCLQPVGSKKHYFVHGSMYHDCLEKIYRAIRAGKVKSVKELPALLGEIEREYLKEMPKDAKSREIVEDGLLRIEPLMLAYFTHYVNDFSIPWVTVEGRFTCDLAPKIKITGTMDGGFHNQKGLFCVFESKFRSRIDAENIADVLALDLQLSFYTAAARAYGYKVGPRRFNIVKKPAQRVKKGETKKAFSARVFAEIMENPRDYFFRFDSPISPREQQVSTYRLTGLCSTYLAWWKSLQARPQEPTILDHLANPGQCDGKYGPCEYLSLCAQGDLSLYVKTDPQARKVQSFEDLPKPKPEKAPKR